MNEQINICQTRLVRNWQTTWKLLIVFILLNIKVQCKWENDDYRGTTQGHTQGCVTLPFGIIPHQPLQVVFQAQILYQQIERFRFLHSIWAVLGPFSGQRSQKLSLKKNSNHIPKCTTAAFTAVFLHLSGLLPPSSAFCLSLRRPAGWPLPVCLPTLGGGSFDFLQ